MALSLITAQLGPVIESATHNIALYILVVGLVFLTLALFAPQSRYLFIYSAIASISVALGWFYVTEGSFFNFTPDVMEVLGFGIIGIAIGRMLGVGSGT